MSILFVLGLAASFIFQFELRWTNILFWALQTGFIVVTIYFVSFTTLLVDVSATGLFGLSYYTIANIYTRIHLYALRGNPNFSDFVQQHAGKPFLLVGVNGGPRNSVHRMVRRMERRFGVRNVLLVDNLFDRGHVLQQATQSLSFVVLAMPSADFAPARQAAEEIARTCGWMARLAEVTAMDDGQEVRPIFKAMLGVAIEMA